MRKGPKKGTTTGIVCGTLRKSSPSSHGKQGSQLSDVDPTFQEELLDVILDDENSLLPSSSLDLDVKDMAQGLTCVLLFSFISVVVGVAAGVAISIHYLEPMDAVVLSLLGGSVEPAKRGSGRSGDLLQSQPPPPPPPQILFHHSKTTIWDPFIAISNRLGAGSDPTMVIDQVSRMELSNADRILLLVEASPPLTSDEKGTYGSGTDTQGLLIRHQDFWRVSQPRVMDPPVSSYEEYSKVKPVLCKDRATYGYDRWDTLIEAFKEANAYSADRFMRWNKYWATTKDTFTGVFDDPLNYYEQDIVLTICPNTLIYGKRGPVAFVNAENIVLQCEGCVIEIKYGSHFSFGPHAKNILMRGIRFRGSSTTSLLFHHDGADVSFEDCIFLDNTAASRQLGTLADVNSTSVVSFYRCLMKNGPSDRVMGSTSLSIRSKDAEL